jgi:hypothetical protein
MTTDSPFSQWRMAYEAYKLLDRCGHSRNRNADHTPRSVAISDDSAVALIEYIHSLETRVQWRLSDGPRNTGSSH